MSDTVDFTVSDHGTIVLVRPVSEGAKAWVAENVELEPWQWFGRAIACDHRPAQALVEAIGEEGFVLELV